MLRCHNLFPGISELKVDMPLTLYRFQPAPTVSDDRLAKLEQRKIWVSDPGKFNDPLDMRPSVKDLVHRWSSAPHFRESVRGAVRGLLAEREGFVTPSLYSSALISILEDWVEGIEMGEEDAVCRAIEQRISELGVVCLTRELSNRLMWAHYADEGRGFCIAYEVEPLQNPSDLRYTPVHYVSSVPTYCLTEALFAPHQFLYRAMATKHVDWAYEKEIRLVSMTGKAYAHEVAPGFLRITGLIAGHAMKQPELDNLKATADRLGVKTAQMHPLYDVGHPFNDWQ